MAATLLTDFTLLNFGFNSQKFVELDSFTISYIFPHKAMLSDNGLLIVSSPYTWKQEHTDLEKWIGGYTKDGVQKFTQNGLQELLAPELKLLEVTKVPFVIPDSDGTFQYTYSNCTIFGRQ